MFGKDSIISYCIKLFVVMRIISYGDPSIQLDHLSDETLMVGRRKCLFDCGDCDDCDDCPRFWSHCGCDEDDCDCHCEYDD